jgi:hypothetical protein
VKFLKEGLKDDKAVLDGLQRSFDILAREFCSESYTFEIANKIVREVSAIVGNDNIFAEMKHESNLLCKAMLPSILERYEGIGELPEKLNYAIAAGVAGNTIDVSTGGYEFKLDQDILFSTIDDILQQGFSIDDRAELLATIQDPAVESFLVMLDNAGEIVFDQLLVRLLKDAEKTVLCMAKGKPVANDATRVDLLETEMDTLCDGILETTTASYGYFLPEMAAETIAVVDTMDVIIGKGQANLETLSVYVDEIGAGQIFLISKVKCQPIADFESVEKGTQIVRKIK